MSAAQVTYHPSEKKRESDFSILIPSWNNIHHLRLCIRSIEQHSHFSPQIIVHVNEGKDGTTDWLRSEGYDYTYSSKNLGVCLAVNAARELASAHLLVYMNDDMYALPDWDKDLVNTARSRKDGLFMLSATMIEPVDTGNPCVIAPADFGRRVESFNEKKLLDEYADYTKEDWSGASWPPLIIHRELWDRVGGFSPEFSPGMSSDPDLSMKLWQAGVRYFRGFGNSRVYHFMARSTSKIKKNPGNRQFLHKWKMTQSTFYKYFLRMGEPFSGELQTPARKGGFARAMLKSYLKRLGSRKP